MLSLPTINRSRLAFIDEEEFEDELEIALRGLNSLANPLVSREVVEEVLSVTLSHESSDEFRCDFFFRFFTLRFLRLRSPLITPESKSSDVLRDCVLHSLLADDGNTSYVTAGDVASPVASLLISLLRHESVDSTDSPTESPTKRLHLPFELMVLFSLERRSLIVNFIQLLDESSDESTV